MSGVVEQVTVEAEGLTLPLIVWRRFRRPMPGLVERTLDLNPGLAALGPVLPLWTTFDLPVETPRPTAVRRNVRLW